MSVNKQRDAGLPRLHVLLVSLHILSSKVSRSLPKSFKSILGLQVGSCLFLYDVFVFCCSKFISSSLVSSSFVSTEYICLRRYTWTELDFNLVQRVERLLRSPFKSSIMSQLETRIAKIYLH